MISVVTVFQLVNMSSKYPNIPNDIKTVKTYIKYLLTLSFVEDVYIIGSRSNKTKKEPNEFSDWDLQIISKYPKKIFISKPRDLGIVNADIPIYKSPSEEAVHWTKIIKDE